MNLDRPERFSESESNCLGINILGNKLSFLIPIFLFSITGCSLPSHLVGAVVPVELQPTNSYFDGYIDKPLKLVKKIELHESYDSAHFYYRNFILDGRCTNCGTFYADLPIDHEITIQKVVKSAPRGLQQIRCWYALGKTTVYFSEVEFEYRWGCGNTIRRAPWETEHTPVTRKIPNAFL